MDELKKRRRAVLEHTKRRVKARPPQFPHVQLPVKEDPNPSNWNHDLVVWTNWETGSVPFEFTFAYPPTLTHVLPLEVMNKIIQLGKDLGQRWNEEREESHTLGTRRKNLLGGQGRREP